MGRARIRVDLEQRDDGRESGGNAQGGGNADSAGLLASGQDAHAELCNAPQQGHRQHRQHHDAYPFSRLRVHGVQLFEQ